MKLQGSTFEFSRQDLVALGSLRPSGEGALAQIFCEPALGSATVTNGRSLLRATVGVEAAPAAPEPFGIPFDALHAATQAKRGIEACRYGKEVSVSDSVSHLGELYPQLAGFPDLDGILAQDHFAMQLKGPAAILDIRRIKPLITIMSALLAGRYPAQRDVTIPVVCYAGKNEGSLRIFCVGSGIDKTHWVLGVMPRQPATAGPTEDVWVEACKRRRRLQNVGGQ